MPLYYFSFGKLAISLVLPEKLIMPSASLSPTTVSFLLALSTVLVQPLTLHSGLLTESGWSLYLGAASLHSRQPRCQGSLP